MHLLQFHLHVFAHLQVESCQWFVEQQHFRFVDYGTCDSHTLLLSAGQRIYVTVFIVRHPHHLQSSLHLLLNGLLRHLFQLQPESNIIIYIQMRKQSVLLKHRVYRTFVRRSLRDFLPRYFNFAFRSSLEAGNKA